MVTPSCNSSVFGYPKPIALLTSELRILSLLSWTSLFAFSTISRRALTSFAMSGDKSSSLKSKKSAIKELSELLFCVPSSPRILSAGIEYSGKRSLTSFLLLICLSFISFGLTAYSVKSNKVSNFSFFQPLYQKYGILYLN